METTVRLPSSYELTRLSKEKDDLLVKRNTVWGTFKYYVRDRRDDSSMNWGVFILAMLFGGFGIITAPYWAWKKGKLKDEVEQAIANRS